MSESEIMWTVVLALVTLVGLFLTVGKPILKLNSTLTVLTSRMDSIEKAAKDHEDALKEQKLHAHESHKRLWDHNSKQDEQLRDHEHRLGVLEKER